MSTIADRIRTAQDKDGMLRRALERIIQLYTDKSHFVYELLQNAEDAEATSVKFVQYPDRLEVFHDGRPFTSDNLQGLCDIGRSDKVDNLNQIGEFGVGFKSVFGICENVLLYSEPSHYRGEDIGDAIPFAVEIHDFTRPEDIEPEQMANQYTTRFVFPFAVGQSFSGFSSFEQLSNTLARKLQNLGITTLLFMHNLEEITYEILEGDNSISGQYMLEKNNINDHCSFVSAIGMSSMQENEKNNDRVVSYLKFSRALGDGSQRTVDIAFPVEEDDNGKYTYQVPESPYVSVYFPTETESKLDFIVQGPYRTTPNRSSIPADDEDNIRLANLTASLLRDSVLELKQSGQLNMSLFRLLPVSDSQFANFPLFLPLHEEIKALFRAEEVIPTLSGNYTKARVAKIARQDRLARLFSDEYLSDLIHDGLSYSWLPTVLTETNREYEKVYRFLTGELKVPVIRPEDLRAFFENNPAFLPQRTEDWLVELYSMLENVGAAFSRSRNEANMLTASIVKTTDGSFASAYRQTENKQYIPNIFVPTKNTKNYDILFVDEHLYLRSRHFFDDILQLQKPNEYEVFITDFKKRYSAAYSFEEDDHTEDVKSILRFLNYTEYRDEIKDLINNYLVLRCSDNTLRNPNSRRIYLPKTEDGIDIEGYYRNITTSVSYIDVDFYALHDISIDELKCLGIRDSIFVGDTVTSGPYDTGGRGRQPEWWTTGEFRWKLSLDSIKEVLQYISAHPSARDSILKSQAIYRALINNEEKLYGNVRISGNTPNLDNETCELVKVLNGERISGWNGKWLFTDSLELVSQKTVSKHDISSSIYGRIKTDSKVYEILRFRKTEADEVDDLKKTIPQSQLDAFFESELKFRYGISAQELAETFGANRYYDRDSDESDDKYPFPIGKVKNWETLRKHAAEMLSYADPVKYQYTIRRIRTSNHEKEARAYLHNMYRYDGVYRYACQLCHESSANIERAQIFKKVEVELDPMNLCLCPNCAAEYRQIRDNDQEMNAFRDRILGVRESDVSNGEQVIIPLADHEVWFTQTHFAEIQELLRLSDEVKKTENAGKLDHVTSPPSIDDEDDVSGLEVYSGYVGKTIRRKDGFEGVVKEFDGEYLHVDVLKGLNAGKTTKIQLSFVLNNKVYSID